MDTQKCQFCNSSITATSYHSKDALNIKCPLCGDYIITGSAQMSGAGVDVSSIEKILFSGYLRNYSNAHNSITVDTDTLKKIKEFTDPFQRLSVDERIDLIINYLAKNTQQLGSPVSLRNIYTVFYLRNEGELFNIINWLEEMKLGKRQGIDFILGVEGWRRYERLKEVNVNSKQVFVAMSADEDHNNIFIDGIKPSCDACDFRALKMDLIEHNEKICDKIVSEIKNSRFVIADVTGERPNVYYEAGYALGIGLVVIWTAKIGEKLHFDTRQYKHILWENTEDLRVQLTDRIKATIV